MRKGTSLTNLTSDRLNDLFPWKATFMEQARRTLDERHRLIGSDEAPRALGAGPICVAHVIPIVGLSGEKEIDIHRVFALLLGQLQREAWKGCRATYNFDGVMLHDGERSEPGPGYVQFFRNSSVESAEIIGTNLKEPSFVVAPTVE